jgi:predicted anti-sigma-YlaC factor YlaD
MSEHLSGEQIESYRQRMLSPAELLAVDAHIASCEACRSQLARAEQLAQTFAFLRTDLRAEARAEPLHLSHEQFAAYVENDLDEVDREIVESHLELCPQCAAEVRELRGFKTLVASSPPRQQAPAPPLSWRQRLRPLWGGQALWLRLGTAGAAAAVMLLIFWTTTQRLRTEITSLRARNTELQQTADSLRRQAAAVPELQARASGAQERAAGVQRQNEALQREIAQLRQDREKLRQQQRTLLAGGQATRREKAEPGARQRKRVLKDGAAEWTEDEHGRLVRVAMPEVQMAYNRGEPDYPADLPRLQERQQAIRGGPGDAPSVIIQAPAGVVVESDRPVFSWAPFPGATGYQLLVTDYRTPDRVVLKGETASGTETEWKAPEALPRGRIYRWQVRALKEAAVQARSRPVRFKVLEADKAAKLERARRENPDSHLTLGVLYARAGLLEQAEEEFQALLEANPNSKVAQRLLKSVRAKRKRSP